MASESDRYQQWRALLHHFMTYAEVSYFGEPL